MPDVSEREKIAVDREQQPGSVRREHVAGSGIYPASGPHPAGAVAVRGQGELAHPEERRARALLPPLTGSAAPLLLARGIFGGYFIYNAMNHFQNREMVTGYARAKGVPAAAAAVPLTGAMLMAGGLSLIAGYRPKLGVSLITTFLLGVSPVMHAFWKEQDPQQQMAETVNFTKNMALLGGAWFAAALPEPWRYSIAR